MGRIPVKRFISSAYYLAQPVHLRVSPSLRRTVSRSKARFGPRVPAAASPVLSGARFAPFAAPVQETGSGVAWRRHLLPIHAAPRSLRGNAVRHFGVGSHTRLLAVAVLKQRPHPPQQASRHSRQVTTSPSGQTKDSHSYAVGAISVRRALYRGEPHRHLHPRSIVFAAPGRFPASRMS